jgi:hypothetical protein
MKRSKTTISRKMKRRFKKILRGEVSSQMRMTRLRSLMASKA